MKSAHVIERNDLLLPGYRDRLHLFELRGDPDINSSHVYMEAQIFTPDSRRFVFHQSAHAHGSDPLDPRHRYLLCEPGNPWEVVPLTDEPGATAPSISPDGSTLYYFVNETVVGGGRLTLKRVNLDRSNRETMLVLDRPLPGVNAYPSRIYPLSSIRSDGRRLALAAYLGDGSTANAPWGLMVFNLEKPAVEVIVQGPTWCNLHPQYCRSTDPVDMRDIMIQENHGNTCDVNGQYVKLVGGAGADIHLIRDDGTNLRDFPWCRDGREQCQGHQCWRGQGTWGITSTGGPDGLRLLESQAVPHTGHDGFKTPGGTWNDLSRLLARPAYLHFATDRKGKVMISDTAPSDGGGRVVVMELGEPGQDPFRHLQVIAHPHTSWEKSTHPHPFLSPDGTMGFFNSDESGTFRAYGITGLDRIWSGERRRV